MEGGDGGMEKYVCIFDGSKLCPVKQEYKLKPESLVEFCKICLENNRWNTLKDVIPSILEELIQIQKSSQQTQ